MTKPEFSYDWFQHVIPIWQQIIGPAKDQPELKFLEIGTFEGRSAYWLLENVLTHESSRLTTLDPFLGEPGYDEATPQVIEMRARKNLAKFGQRVNICKGRSDEILPSLPSQFFDFVYVDGSHWGPDVYFDGQQAIRLTKRNALIVFDDYEWTLRYEPAHRPKAAIDRLYQENNQFLSPIFVGYQIFFLRK